ncbi:DUF2946 domain-containing protein [Massilia sp. TN1-12]|uniref:DUF2946 domain-containing protein n=1 Tax=Massilia paldalensis TaxID=3377675 RepID=UPI00384A8D78
MGTSLRHRCVTAWIAMLAVLFGVLAPSVSQALPASQAVQDVVEICTAHGIQLLQQDAAIPGGDDALAKNAGHCAYCLTHAHPVAMTPPTPFVLAVLRGHDDYPPLYYRSARPLAAWIAAQSRAPPAFFA